MGIWFKRLLLALSGTLGLALIWALYLTGSIWFYGGSRIQSADAAIVLGAAVANGEPTPVFEERIRHGVSLYQQGRIRYLVLTGGIGYGDTLAESEVARNYCLRHRVPASALRIEKSSKTTDENLLFALPLVEPGDRVLIVSDPLHLRRAVTIARDLGLNAAPEPTPSSRYRSLGSRLAFLLRESFFYAGYLFNRSF